LLQAVLARARQRGLLQPAVEASIDATGLESHYVSHYFLQKQQGRCKRHRRWLKLMLVCDNRTHLILGAVTGVGPSNDAAYFAPAITQAAALQPIQTLLGDAAFDSEGFHRLCREELGIENTCFPINPRRCPAAPVKGRYRRQMAKHFPAARYGQRWQAETVMSCLKRLLGPHLKARSNAARACEAHLRVITYNLMILYAHLKSFLQSTFIIECIVLLCTLCRHFPLPKRIPAPVEVVAA